MSENKKKTTTSKSASKSASKKTSTVNVVEETTTPLTNAVETTSTAPTIDKDVTIANLTALVQSLQQQLINSKLVSASTSDVTLVYTDSCPGFLFVEGAGLELHCTKYGETFVLSRSQLDALIGKYRRWFNDGRLALADKNADIAAEKGVPTVGELALSKEKLQNLGKMTVTQLEQLWNSITQENQKSSLVLYYKRKFIENTEPGYRDRAKIDLLNRLTNNGFAREAIEVSGIANIKIAPTALM